MHGDINIFHVCDINEDQMKYGSWAIRCNGEVFWRTTFGPLTLLTQKIKILKKWQNTRAYIILHLCNTNDDHDAWFMRYQAWQTEFFWHFVLFFALLPHWHHEKSKMKKKKKKKKIKKKKKKKKNAWRYQFTLGHHKWQSCVVPEIWSMTDRTFSHFGSFFALLPPNNPENQNFEKMKRYIIILHNYTKNHDHILYCSLNMVCDGCNFYFQFWAIFTLLPPEHHKKSKFLKNEKNAWRYHFTHVH